MKAEKQVILLLVALLVGLVLSGCGGDSEQKEQTEKARVTTTKVVLRMLHSAITQFKMDTGRLPTEEEGLMALIEPQSDVENYQLGGYLDATDVPKDGWGREFVYRILYEDRPVVIFSYGADGKEGGDGYDADLSTAPTVQAGIVEMVR